MLTNVAIDRGSAIDHDVLTGGNAVGQALFEAFQELAICACNESILEHAAETACFRFICFQSKVIWRCRQ